MAATRAVQGGILFEADPPGKSYISLHKHRGAGDRRHKHMWAVEFVPTAEHALFCKSQQHNWSDEDGNYWGVEPNGMVQLGERGEIIAKFPANANPINPWHGYPVAPEDGKENDCPPDELVLAWIETSTITETLGFRIMRRRL
jgi:hypothetical protein